MYKTCLFCSGPISSELVSRGYTKFCSRECASYMRTLNDNDWWFRSLTGSVQRQLEHGSSDLPKEMVERYLQNQEFEKLRIKLQRERYVPRRLR